MRNSIQKSLYIGLISLVVACFQACAQSEYNGNLVNAIESIEHLGTLAPNFRLPDLDGNFVELEKLKGKYAVIHFATTWCPFCNAEAPHLEELYQNYKEKGVEVMIIDVLEPKNLVAKKLRDRFNLSFPILLDSDGTVSASYAPPDVLPELSRDEVILASNLIIDREGRIQFMSLLDTRNFDAKLIELKKKLDKLLATEEKKDQGIGFIEFLNSEFSYVNSDEEGMITLNFQIRDGYHIQANEVNDESLIPCEIHLSSEEEINFGTPVFPEWKFFQIEGTNEIYQIFSGLIEIKIPISIQAQVPLYHYSLKGVLYYQACNARQCFFPEDIEFELDLKAG